jgi:aspartyl-tRNA(Asn)/glutamyl-tRNA(Gln) amidotransferase subunit A
VIAMSANDLLQLTLSDAAAAIQGKRVSPVELTEAALAEAERLQPLLCSFITILYDGARRQAKEAEAALMRGEYRGPLHGIPIGIKDNLATAGIRSTVGSKVLADYVPDEDAEVVRRCKQAGAIILGKENLEEFAAGMTSNNMHYGAVHNPWNLDHVPGGSSGGGGRTWPPVSRSHRSARTSAARCACPERSAASWGSSRRSAA